MQITKTAAVQEGKKSWKKKTAENMNEFDGKLLENVGLMMLHVLVVAKKVRIANFAGWRSFLDTPEELQ